MDGDVGGAVDAIGGGVGGGASIAATPAPVSTPSAPAVDGSSSGTSPTDTVDPLDSSDTHDSSDSNDRSKQSNDDQRFMPQWLKDADNNGKGDANSSRSSRGRGNSSGSGTPSPAGAASQVHQVASAVQQVHDIAANPAAHDPGQIGELKSTLSDAAKVATPDNVQAAVKQSGGDVSNLDQDSVKDAQKQLDAMQPPKEATSQLAGKGGDALKKMINDPGFGDKLKQVADIGQKATDALKPGQETAQHLNDLFGLMGSVQKDGMTPQNMERLQNLMQGAEKALSPDKIAELKQQFPDMKSLQDAFPELKNLQGMSRDQLQQWQNRAGDLMKDFNAISDLRNGMAGQDGVLKANDIKPSLQSLEKTPQFQQTVNGLIGKVGDYLQQHRMDGSDRIFPNLVGNVVRNYVYNHADQLGTQATGAINQGADRILQSMGAPNQPPDPGQHTLTMDGLQRALQAGQNMTGRPYQSLNDMITQNFTQKLYSGGVYGLQNQGRLPTQDSVAQAMHSAIDSTFSSPFVQDVLNHTFDNFMPNAIQNGITAEDINRPWRVTTSVYNILGSLLGN